MIDRTEFISPFSGESYAALFGTGKDVSVFSPNYSYYSEYFTQKGYSLTEKINPRKFLNSVGCGIVANAFLSSDVCVYALSGAVAGFLSVKAC
ncbi:MAG: hypothetical protein U9P44_02150 [archaeon]|nr:hypothetical protein [archaeon]